MRGVLAAITAEGMKLRRSAALRLAIAVPTTVVLLQAIIASQQPLVAPTGSVPLVGIVQNGFFLWTLLVLPMYAALAAAFVAGVDHQEDHWKQLFALPIHPRAILLAKWIVTMALVLLSFIVLAVGLLALAGIFKALRPAWPTLPGLVSLVAIRMAQGVLAASLFVSIQVWVSLRWRTFMAGPTVAVMAVVVMLAGVARAGGRGNLVEAYPWALPVTAVARIAESTPARSTVVLRGAIGGVFIALAGCFILARREWW
jgi:hypothetical protein